MSEETKPRLYSLEFMEEPTGMRTARSASCFFCGTVFYSGGGGGTLICSTCLDSFSESRAAIRALKAWRKADKELADFEMPDSGPAACAEVVRLRSARRERADALRAAADALRGEANA
jgi:hypothetical protein